MPFTLEQPFYFFKKIIYLTDIRFLWVSIFLNELVTYTSASLPIHVTFGQAPAMTIFSYFVALICR